MNFFKTFAMVGLVGIGMAYGEDVLPTSKMAYAEDATKKKYVVFIKLSAPFTPAIRSRLRFEYMYDDKGLFYSVIREIIRTNKSYTATPFEGTKNVSTNNPIPNNK